MQHYPDYTRPVYRKGAYDYPEFAGYAGAEIWVQSSRYRYDKIRGAYVYDSGPDPELGLYNAVTGRTALAWFTHAQWRDEYAVTGQSIAMERMLALVTETTHCDALDGPESAPAPVRTRRTWTGKDWAVLAFLMAVALTAVLMVVL